MANTINLPIDQIKKMSIEYRNISDEGYLFKLYNLPDDWQDASEVGTTLRTMPGAIDIEMLRALAQGAENYRELRATLKQWP